MNFLEYQGKSILSQAGLAVPESVYCQTPDDVADAVARLGPSVVKAQVPTGKRGKAGGIRLVDSPAEAHDAAVEILALTIGGYRVESLLVERKIPAKREFYAAVTNDLSARTPLILFSVRGGVDIEELAAKDPNAICKIQVEIDKGPTKGGIRKSLSALHIEASLLDAVTDFLLHLYKVFIDRDAELVEINPLALLGDGSLLALDCKLTLDDAAAYRQEAAVALRTPERKSKLEELGARDGLKFIELGGNVGVLANGAGLTMTTMDVISHFGGKPANFLEIGGDAYTKAEPALKLVLANPQVKSLVINFCGAFARTDVMTEGIVKAWKTLKPAVPIFFSIHGTGEDEAVSMLRTALGITPFEQMEDAVSAAVEASK